MDAFGVLRDILDDYKSFVHGFLNILDPDVLEKVEQEVSNGLLWPEPWLALNPAFQAGGTVSELVERGWLHPGCREIFRTRTPADPFGREISFHKHQADAIEIASRRESCVLTTGTGSGKSMSYIVPIVDRILREGSGQGVRAIVVYPMNALANSQRGELEKFLGIEKPKVSFARYTGQEKRAERDAILDNPPDILLTNYVMLELMLTRPKERGSLINSAANLSFLVLDELHTYRGRQGADVAMLIRRLRAAIGSTKLQCVGTSATLAGPGTRAEQRAEVAGLASRLFGTATPRPEHRRRIASARHGRRHGPAASPGPELQHRLQRLTPRFSPMIWPYGSSARSACVKTTKASLPVNPRRGCPTPQTSSLQPPANLPITASMHCATPSWRDRAHVTTRAAPCSRSSCTSS